MSDPAAGHRPRMAGDRTMLLLAAQALGGLAVEPLYILVDTAIVGRLGTPQLGGVAIAASLLSFIATGSNFLAYGTTERVARRLGGGDRTGATKVGAQALWLAVLVASVVVPMLVIGADPFARAFGGDGEVLDHAVTYLRISSVGIPFVLVSIAAQGILRGHTDYRSPLLILLVANAANVVIELVMVFGLDLGVAGSAWSTVVAQAGAAVAFALAIRRRLGGAGDVRPSWTTMQPLLSAGRHLLLRTGSMLAVLGGATAVAARIDRPTLAAHQIAMSLMIFLALVLDAFAIPAQTLVAEQLGAGRPGDAYAMARATRRLSILTAVMIAIVVGACSPVLPHAFTADGAVVQRATVAFVWVAAIMIPGAIAFAHDGVLIGAADYRFLGFVALAYFVVMIPVGLLVLRVDGLGINGVWGGLTLWMLMRAVVNNRRTNDLLGSHAT